MLRATRQRAAVSALLDRLDDFRSAQEIHEELRRAGEGIGLTTVYRTCRPSPTVARWTSCAPAPARPCTAAAPRPITTTTSCAAAAARTVEIEGPDVESWATRVAEAHGFSELSHTAEIFGLCRVCAGAR